MTLTQRELEVLKLLCLSDKNKKTPHFCEVNKREKIKSEFV